MIIGFTKNLKHGVQLIARATVVDLPEPAVQELEAAHPGSVVRLNFHHTAVAVAEALGVDLDPQRRREAAFRIGPCPVCCRPGYVPPPVHFSRLTTCSGGCGDTGKVVNVP